MKLNTTLTKLFLLALLCLTPVIILADGTEPTGTPRQVSTLDHLLWISTNPSSWGDDFEQTGSIDASATATWNSGAGFDPIGESSTPFSGSYDGQGYTISSLTINRPSEDHVGLFGFCQSSTVQGLHLTSCSITGKSYTAGIAGYNSWSTSVINCSASGTFTGAGAVGGLVGRHWGTAATNCSSTGTINNSGSYSGGLIGENTCTVSTCYSTATINGANLSGGLIGSHGTNSVSNSYASGSVTGAIQTGGLIGASFASTSNCYSTGAVSGTSNVGGLLGYQNGSSISNSFSTGLVSGSTWVGGLAGFLTGGSVTNSFWNTTTSSQALSNGGTGKTTSEMKTLATFTDETTVGLTSAWDFETNPNDDAANNDYWDMDLSGSYNSGYPFLSWQNGGDVSLPVGLAVFAANQQGAAVYITWTTESETDNAGYILERRSTSDWQTVASYLTHPELQGQGNTSEQTEYTFVDETVQAGVNYSYRLSDVDTKGDVTTKDVISITLNAAPEATVLKPAYPNPFNPETKIQYELAEDAAVTLKVVDITGRQVQTIVNGQHQTTGSYSVHWNGMTDTGMNASSGVYFLMLRAGTVVKTQKVMLVR